MLKNLQASIYSTSLDGLFDQARLHKALDCEVENISIGFFVIFVLVTAGFVFL